MTSKMMQSLYGEYTDEVLERLNFLEPELKELINDYAYENIWSRPGLSLRDKSLITIVSLVSQGKDEQLKIHIKGFLNSGGSIEELKNTFMHLTVYLGFPSIMNAFAALKEIQKSGPKDEKR